MIAINKTEYVDLIKILDLYNYYILNSTATFHLKPFTLVEIEKALPLNHEIYQTFTIFYDKSFCGYCYLGNYRPRQAYNRTAEVTLYLKPEFQKKGIGKEVLIYLEDVARKKNIKNLLGVITNENTGSVKLFTKMGYKRAGLLKNIGEKFGRVLDVAFYQKELN